jgi:hypothetical protein
MGIKESYLKAASESDLEITVNGLFEGRRNNCRYISIYWDELIIDGHKIKRDFNNI